MKQLALIDSLIPDVAIFKESLNEDTDFIIFDYYNDSLEDLRSKIENGMYENIGIVQEDNGSGRFFHQFNNNTLVEFLKSRHHCKSLDLFMCNGYLSWKPEIDDLAETMAIEIGAATTFIGQGCWTLHNGVDVCERYMKMNHDYSHIFMSKPLTVTGLVIENKVYDKNNSATVSSYTLNGVDNGDIVTLTATFDDVNVGTSKSLTLDLSGQNYNDYYLISTVSNVKANITSKTLTITGVTANNKEYSKTTTATVSGTPTLVGVISGDNVSASFYSGYFSSYGLGTHSVSTTFTLSGSSASNYKVTGPTLSATITQKTLTIINDTFDPQNKTYDKTITLTSTGSLDISGVYNGDECILSGVNTFEDKNAGSNKNIKIGLTGIHAHLYKMPDNYYTATIHQKEVTVSHKSFIRASTKYYDGYNDVSINNWTLDGIYGPDRKYITFGATLDDANVGTNKQVIYTLSDENDNYYLTQPTDAVNGDLTTNVYANTIYYDPSTVIATSKQYNQSDSITVSTPVFRDTNDSIATLVDCSFVGVLTNVNVGTQTVTVSLSGTGASNYILTATNTSKIYATITAINLTVTGSIYALNKAYNGSTSAIVRGMTLNGVLSGDNVGISASSSTFSSANIGTWTVSPVFSLYGTSRSNYTLTQPTLSTISATITTATLTVGGAITVVEKQYDGNTYATISGAELKGLISGDNVSLSVTGSYEDETIGTNKKVYLAFSVSGSGLGNYTFTEPSTTLYRGNIINTIPAPTNVVAFAGVQSASVSFTPPINGVVSYYIVTASTSGVNDAYTTGYSSPIMVDNLKNSAFYRFTVRPYDTNDDAGTGSSESNGITTLSDSLSYTSGYGRTYKVYSASALIVTVSIPSTYMTRTVAYIGDSAFANCSSMTNLTIPSSIISIESNAFSSCNALTTVLFNGDRPELDEATSFNNTAGTIGYYYPDKTGWPGTAITGITLTSLLEITGTKSEGNTLTATQYLSTIGATGLSYRWYSNTSNSNSGGSVIAGATSSTYSYSSSYAYVYVVVSYTMSGSSTSLTSNAF